MLEILSSNDVLKIIVRYHRDRSDLYPDEISVVTDINAIKEIVELLHMLPKDGDHFDPAPVDPEYMLVLFRDTNTLNYDDNKIDHDNDTILQVYGKKVELENDCFLKSDDWNEIQENIYTILKNQIFLFFFHLP